MVDVVESWMHSSKGILLDVISISQPDSDAQARLCVFSNKLLTSVLGARVETLKH